MTALFTAPDEMLRQRLGQVKNAVAFAFPQKRQHKVDLPYAVRDLSRLLTTERAQKNSYWAAPRLLGAYLHYFLPWNLFRLSWLLPGLPLNLKAGDRILDLGSGPLTLPLAFRLCRPQDYLLPLTWLCSDLTPHPMEVGRDIFKQFGALISPELKTADPWRFNLLRAPLELALRKAKGRVNLLTALNVLNELPAPRQDSLEESLGSLFSSMDRALAPGGMILLIEPGTRLGGKIIQFMRHAALARGFEVLSPCTHNAACPFLLLGAERDMEQHSAEAWCHFGHAGAGAPEELQALSAQAGLSKGSVHLSFVLLHKRRAEPGSASTQAGNSALKKPEPVKEEFPARVVSDLIRLPGQDSAHYVCMREGLGLLKGGRVISSGSEVLTCRAKNGGTDAKTGAILLEYA
jgi:ribosomal protein RSM22 (predicted rRNA methylase)